MHSLCTQNPTVAYTDNDSAYGSYKYSKAGKGSRRKIAYSRGSNMHVGEDGQSINPPRIKKKIRPFSAPRHQGLRSAGLKNRVNQGGDGMRPGTQDGQYG